MHYQLMRGAVLLCGADDAICCGVVWCGVACEVVVAGGSAGAGVRGDDAMRLFAHFRDT